MRLLIQARKEGANDWSVIDRLEVALLKFKEKDDLAQYLEAALLRLTEWNLCSSDINGFFKNWQFRVFREDKER